VVLLKNNGILPLDKSKIKTIGVIGPNANSRLALKGNYYGTSSRYITILEGIQDEVEGEVRVLYAKGCELERTQSSVLHKEYDGMMEAMTVAEHSDLVILCLGLDETLEGEERDEGNQDGSGDKKDLELPAVQSLLLKKIASVGKPMIVCLQAGSAINLSFADEHYDAVLQAWYPGARGGRAVADILFGKCSPSGKLPVTFYRSLEGLPEFTDYSMEGRTYRYLKQEPLYPFGYGLTYGNVVCSSAEILGEVKENQDIKVRVVVENQSQCSTEDVVQIYIKDEESRFAVPNHSLCAFKRVKLGAFEKTELVMQVSFQQLMQVNDQGERILDSSRFTLFVGTSQPDSRSVALTGKKPLRLEINLKP
jgi:beta-glucosidase